MKFFIYTLVCIFSTTVLATRLPTSKAEFCERYQDDTRLLSYATDFLNLTTNKNKGGIFKNGVCWWHSRFQRNIFYLTIFRPDLEKPSHSEAIKLIKKIRAGKSIVTIPGFSHNIFFAEAYKDEIQKELNTWQLYDGILLSKWVSGLTGKTKVKASALEKIMKKLYQYVEVDKKIAYQKLQIKGWDSHAWLVIAMTPTSDGYDIGYIDSNRPFESLNYSYKFGDTSLIHRTFGNFVPYLEYTREESRISSIGKTFCGIATLESSDPSDWDKEYKLDLLEAKQVKR